MKTEEQDTPFVVTKDTKISEILTRYGDVMEVMAEFGIKPVGRLSIRRLIGSFITVETAARLHQRPLDEFVTTVNQAIRKMTPRADPKR
jgi:hypothetical protein